MPAQADNLWRKLQAVNWWVILLTQKRLSYLFVILTACDRWLWSKAGDEGQVSHCSHGAGSHVALWVLQQVFCEPQHLWGQETLPELLLVCKQDSNPKKWELFPLSMKLFPMQTVLCLRQGWPQPAGRAARERSCCRDQADALCQAPPLPAAFSQALTNTGTWKIALRVVLAARKNFLRASGDMAPASLIKFMRLLIGGKNSLPFLLSGIWQRKQK